MKKLYLILILLAACVCNRQAQAQTNPYKAPLYWSVYEHHIVKEMSGVQDNYIPEDVWLANINWVDENLKDYGYEMVCLDGWGDVSILNENGYRATHSRHWEHDIAWWSQHLRDRGMKLGIYGNPLWVHVDDNDQTTKIVGTDIAVSSLKNPEENASFPWVQVDRPGAEQYVKGYIKYYADMGINYFRVDFLSWYENGQDRYLGTVGPDRPREHYMTALRWMREAADEYGVFLSLVMPHLFNEAEAELQYGHMFRINEDTGEGGWWKWAEKDKGIKRVGWSVYANPVDGLTYWSYVSGRNKMILDPDFLRINTFANADEKKSVISLCLLAGGPVTVSDQFNTIGPDLWAYQNPELLALNADGFVGKPLTNDPNDPDSETWTGQLSDGDWIIALFNRDDVPQTRSINFSSLGLDGAYHVRDLWTHKDLGAMNSFSSSVPAHGVVVVHVSEGAVNGSSAMHVAALNVAHLNDKGVATVRVVDSEGSPVSNARVEVEFSASFNEKVFGMTNSDGEIILTTAGSAAAPVKINACVISVQAVNFIYAGDQNEISCIQDYRYVAGSFNNWSLKQMSWRDSVWVLTDVNLEAASYELKFANTGNWSGDDWGDATGLSGRASLSTGGKPNVQFTVTKTGNYDITFNEHTLWYAIKPGHQKAMFVGGSFNNWTLSQTPMTLKEDVWEAKDVAISAGNHELKFANTDNWSGDDWGNSSGMNGTAAPSTGGDPNISFTVPESGTFTISFNDISLEYSIVDPGTVTGVDEGKSIGFSVYPNPADAALFIEAQAKGRITIRNSYGLVVEKFQLEDGSYQLDISRYAPGLYHVQFSHGNNLYTRKVIVR